MKKLSLLFVVVILLFFTISCISKEVPVTETYSETEYRTETYTTTEYVATNTDEVITDLIPKKQWWGEWALEEWTSANYSIDPASILFINRTSYYGFDISANQHSKNQIKINYQSTGHTVAPFSNLWIFDLSSVGQISLPTSYEIGEAGHLNNFTYIPTPEEEEWLKHWCNSQNLLATCDLKQTTYIFDCKNIRQFAIISSRWGPYAKEGVDIQSVQLIQPGIEEKTVTRERPVPYEVEKQRTVIQTKKVPFWEALFH